MTTRLTRSQSFSARQAALRGARAASTASSGRIVDVTDEEAESSHTAEPNVEEGPPTPIEEDEDVTRADFRRMLRQADEDRRMFRQTLEQIATGAQAASQPRTAARKMVDPAKYCGGARDLDRFVTQIKRRFDTQPQQFRGEDDKVDYV